MPKFARDNRWPARPALAVVVGAALLAGCGPVTPLAVQTQDVGLSLILGQRKAVDTAPLAPMPFGARSSKLPGFTTVTGAPVAASGQTGPPPARTVVVTTPARTTTTTPPMTTTTTQPSTTTTAPAVACPALNPAAPISLVDASLPGAPVPATYTYRSTIAQTTGGSTQNYDGLTTWQIGSVSTPESSGNYTYAITKTVPTAGFSSTTTYEVVPTGLTVDGQTPEGVITSATGAVSGALPVTVPSVQTPDQAGLYLDKVIEPDGSNFDPVAPSPLVDFPITPGSSIATTATNGTMVLSYTATVGAQTKINACGTPVGVYPVKLTNGKITKVGTTITMATFTETLDIDPNAGGIVVGDTYSSNASQLPSGTVTLNETDTSDVVPKAAK